MEICPTQILILNVWANKTDIQLINSSRWAKPIHYETNHSNNLGNIHPSDNNRVVSSTTITNKIMYRNNLYTLRSKREWSETAYFRYTKDSFFFYEMIQKCGLKKSMTKKKTMDAPLIYRMHKLNKSTKVNKSHKQ